MATAHDPRSRWPAILLAAASLSLAPGDAAGAVGLGHASHRPRASAAGTHPAAAPDQTHGLAGTAPFDVGLYTAFCPRGHPASPNGRTPTRYEAGELQRTLGQARPMAAAASTSEA